MDYSYLTLMSSYVTKKYLIYDRWDNAQRLKKTNIYI